jgi:hypothetical protein
LTENIGNRAIENAAIAWVEDIERLAGAVLSIVGR